MMRKMRARRAAMTIARRKKENTISVTRGCVKSERYRRAHYFRSGKTRVPRVRQQMQYVVRCAYKLARRTASRLHQDEFHPAKVELIGRR